MANLDERLRTTQAVGAIILLVVSLTAPVLVSVDHSVGDDRRETRAIWSALSYGKILVTNRPRPLDVDRHYRHPGLTQPSGTTGSSAVVTRR